MSYAELLEDLFRRRRFGVDLGLERVAAVARTLGGLDRRLPVVRIAGTNGKGSTAALLDAALTASGARTGRFTSPHLCRFTERFMLSGAECKRQDVVEAAAAVERAGGADLTFFEYCTALALALFADVDVAILEVGLGGRLDATRAIPAAAVAITGVGLDHQAILGDSLEAIAVEKAGAAEAGVPVVIGAAGAGSLIETLETEVRAQGARPVRVIREPYAGALALGGEHQGHNAAVALGILEELSAAGLVPHVPALWQRGLATATLPGRFERLGGDPEVILDVAHNRQATLALVRSLGSLPRRRTVLVLGMSADKDPAAVASPLLQVMDEVVVTRSAHSRAFSAADLATRLACGAPVTTSSSVAAAIPIARARAGDGGRVVVAGSVFAVGEARALLLGELCDPAHVSEP